MIPFDTAVQIVGTRLYPCRGAQSCFAAAQRRTFSRNEPVWGDVFGTGGYPAKLEVVQGWLTSQGGVGYGGRSVTVHSVRVSALTTAREQGNDIIDLQDFAGHADPLTTLTYICRRDRHIKSPAYVLKY